MDTDVIVVGAGPAGLAPRQSRMKKPRLELESVTIRFGGLTAVSEVNLDVADEEDGTDANGNPRNASSFEGYFSVDIRGPPSHPGKLRFSDFSNPGLNFGDVFHAELGAKAEVNLDLGFACPGEGAVAWASPIGRSTAGTPARRCGCSRDWSADGRSTRNSSATRRSPVVRCAE